MIRPIPPPMCSYSLPLPNKERVMLLVVDKGQMAVITDKWNLVKCKRVRGLGIERLESVGETRERERL